MEKFIRNNWFQVFIIIFLVMLVVLTLLGIYLNGDVDQFLQRDKDDKRLDIISSIILASISFASALVAIILARTALLFAENEEKREFRGEIEDRIKYIQEVNNKIINSAKELRFISYESFAFIFDYLNKNQSIEVLPDMDKIFKEEFNKNKAPLRKFADAIKQLDSNSLIFKHYKFMLENTKEELFYKNGYKPSDVVDVALAMENKFIDNLNVIEVWNHILKDGSELINKIIEFSRENKIDEHEFNKWVIFSLVIGFSFEKKIYDNENKGKIQSLLFIDILLNLPNSESFKKVSENLESEFYKNHQEYAKNTIDFLSGQIIEERIPELSYVKKFLEKNQEFLEIEIFVNLNKFDNLLKLAKGIAIENNQNAINANVLFNAISYLNLTPYAKTVFSKIMGEHFNRIKPANGGQKYLDLADNNEDIPLDGDMQKFIDELKKHLGDKEFFTIR